MGNPNNIITDHYLKVQALTIMANQETQAVTQQPIKEDSTDIVTLSMAIFIVMLLIGIVGLIITKVRQLNRIIMLIAVAFITSAIPISIKIASQQTDIISRADTEYIPESIVITNLNDTSFALNWQTDKENIGAIRIGDNLTMTPYPLVISEPINKVTGNHQIIIEDLEPLTTYYLHILSGADWYDNQGSPLTVTTLP